jgi:hypothetical protein
METQNKIRKIRKLSDAESMTINNLGLACQAMVYYDRQFKNKALTDQQAVDYQELRDRWFHYPLHPDDIF